MASASPRAKCLKPDPFDLCLALVTSGEDMTRRSSDALVRVMRRMNDLVRDAHGAFVRVTPNDSPPWLDLGAVGADAPMTRDFYSLLVLDLARLFPERGDDLLPLRRVGDLSDAARAFWSLDSNALTATCDAHDLNAALFEGVLWLALKPLYESVAAAFARHTDIGTLDDACPICGAPPWAVCDGHARCGVCETTFEYTSKLLPSRGVVARGAARVFDTQARPLFELDPDLFHVARNPAPVVDLVQSLEPPC